MNEKTYLGVALDIKERKLPIVELPIKSKSDYTEVILMGDFHVGSVGFSEHQLVAYINWIKKNPYVKIVLMGDLIEVGELSNYVPAQSETLKNQIKTIIALLNPIKDRIICILEGNHEERFSKVVEGAIDLSEYITAELGIKDKVLLPGPQKGQLMVLKVDQQYYPIYAIHGHTSAIFNKGTQLKRMAFTSKVPLLAHGHTHSIFHDHYVYRGVTKINGGFYESIFEQHWLTTGCFVKYLGYAEQASYPMTKIGAPIVRFYTKKENMMIIDDARSFYKIGMEYPDNLCNPPSEADNEVLKQFKEDLNIHTESLKDENKIDENIEDKYVKEMKSKGYNHKRSK